VNTAIRQALAEDAEDLAAFEERAREPNLAFEDVLKDLKRRGPLAYRSQLKRGSLGGITSGEAGMWQR
jgi:hypothetical protein